MLNWNHAALFTAAKGIAFLNAWAEANCTFTGSDAPLQLGSHFTAMLYAADLLHGYSGWTEPQRDKFAAFWRAKVLPHILSVGIYNNWGDNALMGLFCAAVVLEDAGLLNKAMSMIKSYPSSRIGKDPTGTQAVLASDITRNSGTGDHGLTYTDYALSSHCLSLDIARNYGVDAWKLRASNGLGYPELIGSFFKWYTKAQPWPYSKEPIRDRAWLSLIFLEYANSRLGMSPLMGTWLAANRPLAPPSKLAHADIYCTLLKGDLPDLPPGGGGSVSDTTKLTGVFSPVPYFGDAHNYAPNVKTEDGDKRLVCKGGEVNGNIPGAFAIAKDRTYTSFTLQFKAKSRKSLPTSDFIAVFGHQNPTNFYYVIFSANATDNQLFALENGQRRLLSNLGKALLTDTLYHDFAIERWGATIKIAHDGGNVLTVTDTTFTSGSVGVGSYNDPAIFDDIRVEALPGPTVSMQPPVVRQSVTLPKRLFNLLGRFIGTDE